MPPYSSPHQIRTRLFSALEAVGEFDDCVCLAYPHYFNVGDHLIWLGLLSWISDVRQAHIAYTASIFDFSESAMQKKNPGGAIFFRGGGNLGDLWPLYQRFRESVIARNHHRKIVIMPQSIYFKDNHPLEAARRVFNAHPDLTIFTRDQQSYELAKRNFERCKIFLAPDLCFVLKDLGNLKPACQADRRILYLCRKDKELDSRFSPSRLPNLGMDVQDWSMLTWRTRKIQAIVRRFPRLWNLLARSVYVGKVPKEILEGSDSFFSVFQKTPRSERQAHSVYFAALAIFQLCRYRLVITNRLHAHILCVMLGIPHVFLPNSYHKNEAYYRTWTSEIPACRFVDDPSKVSLAVNELLS